MEQRNEWQQRAISADATVVALRAKFAECRPPPSADGKFDELRRFLAREFHFDHSKSEGIEKIIRSEIFKSICPKVEEIAKSGS